MFDFDFDLFAQTCCWDTWTSCHEFRNTADRYRHIVWKKDTSQVKEPESFLVSREESEDTQSQILLVKNYCTKWSEVVSLAVVAILLVSYLTLHSFYISD